MLRQKGVAAAVLAGVLAFGAPVRSWGMLASPEAAYGAAVRADDVKTVQSTLESRIVRERLKDFGLSDREVEARLSRMSDKEVHQLARDIRALNPGGADVAGVLVIAILVLLVIYLVDAID